MNFAVMQPYFMPYIGYFQLINAVDKFIIYDNIEFTKKGWINRNRILVNGKPQYFTVNINKGSDYALIKERSISPVFEKNRRKILAQIEANYRQAPYYKETLQLIQKCLECNESCLFQFIFSSIQNIVSYLDIETELIASSSLNIDHSLKNKYKLWAMGDYLGVKNYVNPQGGHDLYHKDEFREHGLNLSFHQSHLTPYSQTGANEFFPALSIIDILMNLGREGARQQLDDYILV